MVKLPMEAPLGFDLQERPSFEVNLLVLNTLLDIRDLDELILVEKLSGARPAEESVLEGYPGCSCIHGWFYRARCW